MSGTYIQYPNNGLTGSVSATVIAFGVGALDGQAPLPTGITISSTSIFMQSASATFPGLVNSTSQTFQGVKTFLQPVVYAANGSASFLNGSLYYDNQSVGPTFQNSVSSISLQIGQENWVMVQNNSGATIGNGRAVYITGSVNGNDIPTIGLARANASSTSALLGVATHDIANNGTGFVTQSGKVHGIDTSAYSGGQRVWLSTSSAGFFQVTDPAPPNFSIFVGYVLDVGVATGSLFLSGIRSGAIVPFTNPMTSSGDLIVGSGSGIATRLALGTPNQTLIVNSGSFDASWRILNVASQTQGSLSLTTQVVGILPAANLPPLSSITGSVSLTTQVSGILPQANMTGVLGTNTGDISIAAFGAAPNTGGASIGAGQVLTLQPASFTLPGGVTAAAQSFGGTKTFTAVTVGSVTFNNSSTGGSSHSYVLPGAQGASGTALLNNGSGNLGWVPILTNPFTASGDIIVSSGTNTVTNLGIGTNAGNRFLTVSTSSLIPSWVRLPTPTVQVFTSGSGSCVISPTTTWLRVRLIGGGGGGAGTVSAGSGGTGSSSSFGGTMISATGGVGGLNTGPGGGGGTATINAPASGFTVPGGNGGAGGTSTPFPGPSGGNGFFGGAGQATYTGAGANGISAATNSGAGGSAGTAGSGGNNGAGGAGGYAEAIVTGSLSASYAYTVGAGGTAGTGTNTGGVGGAGLIVVEEYK